LLSNIAVRRFCNDRDTTARFNDGGSAGGCKERLFREVAFGSANAAVTSPAFPALDSINNCLERRVLVVMYFYLVP
jgi:hypothetical protein